MDDKRVMLVLSGVPAAGKSTLASELTRREFGSVHLCFDPILSSLGEFTPERWQTAQLQFYSQVEVAARASLLVIVDDNLNYLSMVKKYQKLAANCNCVFLHIVLQVDLPTALSRNQTRLCPVPRPIIEKMHAQMESQRFLPTSQVLTSRPLEQLVDVARTLVRDCRSKEPETGSEQPVPSTAASTPLHRADLHLRSLISRLLTPLPSSIRVSAGPSLALIKSQVMCALRAEVLLDTEEAEREAEGRLWEQVARLRLC